MSGFGWKRTLRVWMVGAALAGLAPGARAWEKWVPPTPEELSMTSQKEVPGAPAVYLFREEITDDHLHMWSTSARLKVLNEKGKDFANVQLGQRTQSDGGGYTIEDITGRTIHADGTVIPFTGKPYQKLIEKSKGVTVSAKVFTLPDVQVGSIIEYRYVMRYDDHWFIPPSWYIQTDLFTRKAHYMWRPTSSQLTDSRGGLTSSVAWTPILPQGATVTQTTLPGNDQQTALELNVEDIAPMPEEEYMPPIRSLSYRVMFYYSSYRTTQEFWKNEGKYWSKTMEKFIGPNKGVTEAVGQLVGAGDTQEQKLKKLYAAVMGLENTDFTREHSRAEDKATVGVTKTTDDLWAHKRGSGDELTQLFVGMARAAGMKAYVMAVPNRQYRLFVQQYMNASQLDDLVAIVTVDGKERFFDPGQRYCPFGQMAWQHELTMGMREVDGGTALVPTPGGNYSQSRIQRVGDLTMDRQGGVHGTLTTKYTGLPAMRWRQAALRGDETSVEHDLRVMMEETLPKGLEVKVGSVQKLTDYEEPLVVNYEVKGSIGSAAGKRLLLPGDLFVASETTTFPHEKREQPVCFEYPYVVQDAVRVKFPAELAVESVPAPDKQMFRNVAAYSVGSDATPTSVTVRRNFTLGDIIFPVKDYSELRGFYTKVEAKDQEGVVLKLAANTAPGN